MAGRRDRLLPQVWPCDNAVEANAMDTTLARCRIGATIFLLFTACDVRIGQPASLNDEGMAAAGEGGAREALRHFSPAAVSESYGPLVDLRGSGFLRPVGVGDALVLVRTGIFEKGEVPIVITVLEGRARPWAPEVGIGTAGGTYLRYVPDCNLPLETTVVAIRTSVPRSGD